MANKTRGKGQDGQAMMEMVLVFPILLLFFLGFLGTGTLLLHKIKLCMAVREAAVEISRGQSAPTVEERLRSRVCGGALGLSAPRLTLDVTPAVCPQGLGGDILRFVEFISGDLTGRRVELKYREQLPFARGWGGLDITESCVILVQ